MLVHSYIAEILHARNVLCLSRPSEMQDQFWLLVSLASGACISGKLGKVMKRFFKCMEPRNFFFLHEGELELSAQPWKKWSTQVTFSNSITSFLSGSLGCMVLTCTLPPGCQRKIILLSSRICHLVTSSSTHFVLFQTVPVLVTGGGMGGGGCQRNNYLQNNRVHCLHLCLLGFYIVPPFCFLSFLPISSIQQWALLSKC